MPNLDPKKRHPMVMPDGTVIKQVVQLKPVIDHPRIEVGDFSYYHNFAVLDDYATAIAPYLFPLSAEKLVIGKFVQIAHGVRFITDSANHRTSGFSTYPFSNFMMTAETSREDVMAMFEVANRKGDTRVGNDVWIGMDAVLMPGVTIGDGAIIGSRSVVVKDVEPYTVVGGNPGRKLKSRFSNEVVEALLQIKWWDWPVEKIEENLDAITGDDLGKLLAIGKT